MPEPVCPWLSEYGVLVVNTNTAGHMEIAGVPLALARAAELARVLVPPRISFASQSPLPQEAARRLAEMRAVNQLPDPVPPMRASIQGRVPTTADEVRQHMVT